MTETVQTTKRWPWLRLPSFAVAIAISVAILLAFLVWILIDSSFSVLLEVIRIDLGLQENPGLDMALVHGGEWIGPRLLLFIVLAIVGLLTTLLTFYRVVIGDKHGRTIRALFLSVALVGLWLTLILSHDKLEHHGYRLRMHRAVAGLKKDAALLLASWPKADGMLPYAGEYTVDVENPDLLYTRPHFVGYPMTERIGIFITRADHDAIRFDVHSGDRVEYRPDGTTPTEFTQVIYENGEEGFRMRWFVDTYEKLEQNWYLVSYLPDVKLPPD